jgi:hypothetical protein
VNLKLDDLFQTCSTCAGTTREDERVTRPNAQGQYVGSCRSCSGRGGRLTPAGGTVLEFMRRLRIGEWLDGIKVRPS